MTTLNGLPKSWDSFIRGICSRSKLTKFSRLWEDCIQEEARPKEKSVVTSKWLYKIKYVADGTTQKFKARFVARGFSQKEGIDYEETFAPVARYTSIRATMTIVSKMGKLHQMDIKIAFLETHDSQPHVC